MQSLPPEALAEYAELFRVEANLLVEGRKVAQRIELELTRLVERNDRSEGAIVLEALAHGVISNLQRYTVGADLTLLAWITRNIFELETILAFVTASPDNLKSFMNDVILDEIQIREAVSALGFDSKDPEIACRQDEALSRLHERKAKLALTRNGPMFTSAMAREISPERGKEYQSFNRFYSKVVHPTAYLLMGGKLESTNWNAYGRQVILQGVQKATDFCSRWCAVMSPAGHAGEPAGFDAEVS